MREWEGMGTVLGRRMWMDHRSLQSKERAPDNALTLSLVSSRAELEFLRRETVTHGQGTMEKYVCVYVYIHTCVDVCACVCTCVNVSMCVYMCVCGYVHVCVCVHMCQGQKSTPDISLNCSPSYFLRQSFSLVRGFLIRLGWLTSKS